MKMNTQIVTSLLLLVSGSPLVATIPGKLKESPIDGVVEIARKDQKGVSDRHFVNAAQIIRVYTKAAAMNTNGTRHSTAVVITTAESELMRFGDGAGSQSITYSLAYKTPREADEALEQILAELRFALGVKSLPAVRARESGSSENAEQDGGAKGE